GLLHLAAGAFLAVAAWVIPRRIAEAHRTALPALLLDMAPFALAAGLLGLASGRPLFAGLVTFAFGAGFTLTDHTMRRTLREPVSNPGRPVIIVQCESFFDARRLSPLIQRDFLAGFDACRASAGLFGRFDVPAWGANTMRAEFAVLTGVPESELGYDRFNPYYA